MYPILLEFGPLAFPSYFVLIAAGFLLASFLLLRQAKRLSVAPIDYLDLSMVLGVAGFLGARLFHVVVEMPKFYAQNPLAIFKFWYGGFVLYGGVLVATAAGIWFCRRRNLPIALSADLVTPAAVLAIVVGRLGCFLAGCCYGKVCELGFPFSLVFERQGGVAPQAAPLGLPLYATQAWEAFLTLGLYFMLLRLRVNKRFHGAVAAWGLIGYSLIRIAVEFFRGDSDRGLYFNGAVSTAQLLSLVLGIAGAVLLSRGLRRTSESSASTNR